MGQVATAVKKQKKRVQGSPSKQIAAPATATATTTPFELRVSQTSWPDAMSVGVSLSDEDQAWARLVGLERALAKFLQEKSRLAALGVKVLPAFVFYNGTFSPVHAGHIQALHLACEFIHGLNRDHPERPAYRLVFAAMSPCAGQYAHRKLSHQALPTRHRLHLCRIAVDQFNKAFPQFHAVVDPTETFARQLLHPQHTLRNMHDKIERCLKGRLGDEEDGDKVAIFWLCGADLGLQIPDSRLKYLHNLCVLTRPLPEDRLQYYREILKHSSSAHLIEVSEKDHLGLSSSLMRERIATAGDLSPFFQYQPVPGLLSVAETLRDLAVQLKSLSAMMTLPPPTFEPLKSERWRPDVNAQWLSKHLGRVVESMKCEDDFGYLKGWRSCVMRLFDIVYSQESGDHPETDKDKLSDQKENEQGPCAVICKFTHRGVAANMLAAEHNFYSVLGPLIALRAPRCYYSGLFMNGSSSSGPQPHAILVLADGSPMRSLKPGKGTIEQAITIVRRIAEFHALFWQHPELTSQQLFPKMEIIYTPETLGGNAASGAGVLARNTLNIECEEEYELCRDLEVPREKFVKLFTKLLEKLQHSPQTLIHGDLWVNNYLVDCGDIQSQDGAQESPSVYKGPRSVCLLDAPEAGDPVFIDWQTCCVGPAAFDLASVLDAFYLHGAQEELVVRVWWESINAWGIAYSYPQLILDLSRARALALAVETKMLACSRWSNREDPMMMFIADRSRHLAHLLRIECPTIGPT